MLVIPAVHHLILYFSMLFSRRHINPNMFLEHVVLTILIPFSNFISVLVINTVYQLHHLFSISVLYHIHKMLYKSMNSQLQQTFKQFLITISLFTSLRNRGPYWYLNL